MGNKLENAKALYLEGIRDGNACEAVTKYTGERYTQHSTGVADGVQGFLDFFEPFIERNPVRSIEVVRGLEDGRYVFLQVYQELNHGRDKWITTDLFDTDDNDKIIEHWDVIGPVQETSLSGRSQIDGPTEITDLEDTHANKAVVNAFLNDVLLDGNFENVTNYISSDTYRQHNPKVRDGIAGFAAFAEQLEKQGLTMKYESVFKVIGQGNFVVSYSEMSLGVDRYAVFDIFRLEHGLIVEHWDNMEKILPKEQWGNSGKF
ncbi:MAG: nuclear transport factor 2 family protein [Pseudomonadota bacterium]